MPHAGQSGSVPLNLSPASVWPLAIPEVPCPHTLSLQAELSHPITLFPHPQDSEPNVLPGAPQGS